MFLEFIKGLVPYLPTMLAVYLIIKFISSSLSLVTKILSILVTCTIAYWLFSVLVGVI